MGAWLAANKKKAHKGDQVTLSWGGVPKGARVWVDNNLGTWTEWEVTAKTGGNGAGSDSFVHIVAEPGAEQKFFLVIIDEAGAKTFSSNALVKVLRDDEPADVSTIWSDIGVSFKPKDGAEREKNITLSWNESALAGHLSAGDTVWINNGYGRDFAPTDPGCSNGSEWTLKMKAGSKQGFFITVKDSTGKPKGYSNTAWVPVKRSADDDKPVWPELGLKADVLTQVTGETVTLKWSIPKKAQGMKLGLNCDQGSDRELPDGLTESDERIINTGGDQHFFLVVRDGSGKIVAYSNTAVVHVKKPAAPVIEQFKVDPPSPKEGEDVTLSWKFDDKTFHDLNKGDGWYSLSQTDPDGKSFTFSSASGGFASARTMDDGRIVFPMTAGAGTWKYLLRVQNSRGQDTKPLALPGTYDPNEPPRIEDFSASRQAAGLGDTVTFSWSVNIWRALARGEGKLELNTGYPDWYDVTKAPKPYACKVTKPGVQDFILRCTTKTGKVTTAPFQMLVGPRSDKPKDDSHPFDLPVVNENKGNPDDLPPDSLYKEDDPYAILGVQTDVYDESRPHTSWDVTVALGTTVRLFWKVRNLKRTRLYAVKVNHSYTDEEKINEALRDEKAWHSSFPYTCQEDMEFRLVADNDHFVFGDTVKQTVRVHTLKQLEHASNVTIIAPVSGDIADDTGAINMMKLPDDVKLPVEHVGLVGNKMTFPLINLSYKQRLGKFKYGELTGSLSLSIEGEVDLKEGTVDKAKDLGEMCTNIGYNFQLSPPSSDMQWKLKPSVDWKGSSKELSITPLSFEMSFKSAPGYTLTVSAKATAWAMGKDEDGKWKQSPEFGTLSLTGEEAIEAKDAAGVTNKGKFTGSLKASAALTFQPDWVALGLAAADFLADGAEEAGEVLGEAAFGVGALELALIAVVFEMGNQLLQVWKTLGEFYKIEEVQKKVAQKFEAGFRAGLASGMTEETSSGEELEKSAFHDGSASAEETFNALLEDWTAKKAKPYMEKSGKTYTDAQLRASFKTQMSKPANIEKLVSHAKAKFMPIATATVTKDFFAHHWSSDPALCNAIFCGFYATVSGSTDVEVDSNGVSHPIGFISKGVWKNVPGDMASFYAGQRPIGAQRRGRYFIDGLDPVGADG